MDRVIDKIGMIRAESPSQGDPNLRDEAKLKALIESLLSEGSAQRKPSTSQKLLKK